ncbi:putative bifunctional diguanylate cyclase/phosphodiesterase [Stappia indica]|uniref:Diguanylate cyclase/phosphodiesterase n=1 Tax=Stappia indica TaxID=538381 RepID=A0A285TCL0_9HYPH|nr:bifunctional diguanylate cyclase/phosphodiesterase [Stappia indica]SOC19804.1 diguanylate cyclase/phosphodiesterase [Stappia indica]
MLDVIACITVDHNLALVALAAGMCVVGAWISFRLFQRARDTEGWTRTGWLFLNGMATGSSIWCTHFIAMLAYETQTAVYFNATLTILSLFLAIVGTALGFALACSGLFRFAPEAGGIVIGAAVATMHYLGMAGYRVDGLIHWNQNYVVASVIASLVFGGLALNRFMRPTTRWCRHGAATSLVLGIVLLHFTGMTAMTVTPLRPLFSPNVDQFWALALAIAGVGSMVIGMGVVTALLDRNTRAVADADLQRISDFDPLTGLGNRSLFSRRLDEECVWADSNDSRLCLVLVNLDDFRSVNDLRGHSAGDAMLAALGARIAQGLKGGEVAMRIGGDEFAVMRRLSPSETVDGFLERLDALFRRPLKASGMVLPCASGMGVAIYPDHGLSASDLLANAGLALARAKVDTIERTCFCDSVMDQAERRRRELSFALRGAVERGEFSLYFQPQMDLETGAFSGAEALVRWSHPEYGSVSPAVFIPIAEENGQIITIGDWVLEQSCRQAVTWVRPVKVAVNLSAIQLRQRGLAERIGEILRETGLDPARLEIEVTESSFMADLDLSLQMLREIQALGVSVALDDFGTGYSALASLRVFPFNQIKLDRGFTSDLAVSDEARAIVHSVLMLGQSLGTPVLAEGVETDEQLAFLRAAGCRAIQGFLYSRPVPAGELQRVMLAPPASGLLGVPRRAVPVNLPQVVNG